MSLHTYLLTYLLRFYLIRFFLIWRRRRLVSKAPFTPRALARVTHPSKLMLKIGSIHTDRRRASTNLRTSNERCQFKLYIGYWTSNNNKWPKCSCRYRTPSPDNTCANDVIDNDVTENDVIDSWMNMHTLLASRPNVVASTRVDATRRARCERGLRLTSVPSVSCRWYLHYLLHAQQPRSTYDKVVINIFLGM